MATLYAVYTDEDKTLTFVELAGIDAQAGKQYNGKTITASWNVLTKLPKLSNNVMWGEYTSRIVKVDFSKCNTWGFTKYSVASMFRGCSSLTDIDFGNWTSMYGGCTDMSNMFYGCSKLTYLDLRKFDTKMTTNMSGMFYGCTNLKTVLLDSFITSKVTNMSNMFYGCTNLSTLYISDLFKTDNVTSSTSMFVGCTSLPNYNSSKTDVSALSLYATTPESNTDPYLVKYGELYKVASAIRTKAGTTNKLTFPDEFVKSIQNAGINVTVDGAKQTEDMELNKKIYNISRYNLPYQFISGAAVVYNREVHILGGEDFGTQHVVLTENGLYDALAIPANFIFGSAVVYNNAIYLLNGNSSSDIYKFESNTWTKLPNMPYMAYYNSSVVYNNYIHVFGGGYYDSYKSNHYTFDGATWTRVSTLPFTAYASPAIVFYGDIHLFDSASSSYNQYHAVWDGSSWTLSSTLPFDITFGSVALSNGKIHFLGGSNDYYLHYTLSSDGVYSACDSLTAPMNRGCAVELDDGSINILGGQGSTKTSDSGVTNMIIDKEVYIK